jgi:signal transduction histidine kinase
MMKVLKRLFWVITLTGMIHVASGQDAWVSRRDSLLRVYARSSEDTNRAWTLLWLGAGYIDNQPDSALYYAKALAELSDKLHFAVGSANALSIQAMILSNQNKQDEAIALNLEAIDIAKKAGKQHMLANLYNNTAIIYSAKGDPESALKSYLDAAVIYEQLNDSSSTAFIYSNISSIYNALREYNKGYIFALKGIRLCRSLQQTHGLGAGMVNLSSALILLGRYDTAMIVLPQALALSRIMNDRNEEINVRSNLNIAYAALGQYDLIRPNAEAQMAIADSIGNKEGVCYALISLSNYYAHTGNYQTARAYAEKATTLALRSGFTTALKDGYEQAARVEAAAGDLKNYQRYDQLKDSLENVLFSDKILRNTQDMEAKYSLHEKQAQIDDLNKQQKIDELTLRQHKTVTWVLVGVIVMTLLIASLTRRNYRQKKKLLLADGLLQQKRIAELEKEQRLMAAKAALQGQVEERARLAQELHDGLGSILSGAKYAFAHLRENLEMSWDNTGAFERSMDILDKSIRELRRIAHNMMPEALARFGLDTALRDFCNSIDESGSISLTYQSFGIDETSISKTTASSIYRIVQELVNNIIRHAEATTALVQLVRVNGTLSITVEDNGKGFDKNILDKNSGIGYSNLKTRVAYMNGSVDIQTAVGKGTSVNIEILNLEA